LREEDDNCKLKANGIKMLAGKINVGSVSPVIEWILEENLRTGQHRRKELTLIINSPGGNAYDMFALTDIMTGSKIPIKTIGLGEIASCGFMIFIAGKKGRRILTPNTFILSHQFSAMSYGKQHELVASNKDFELTQDRILKFYNKHITMTNKTQKKKVINDILLGPSDTYLSAEEAKKYGICDEVKLV